VEYILVFAQTRFRLAKQSDSLYACHFTAPLFQDAFLVSYLWPGDDLFAPLFNIKQCFKSNYLACIMLFEIAILRQPVRTCTLTRRWSREVPLYKSRIIIRCWTVTDLERHWPISVGRDCFRKDGNCICGRLIVLTFKGKFTLLLLHVKKQELDYYYYYDNSIQFNSGLLMCWLLTRHINKPESNWIELSCC
jgi:hypothetical protein